MLEGKHFASASEARLDFVQNEHDAAFTAERLQALQIFTRRGMDATFALDWLNQNSGSLISDSRLGSSQIIIRDVLVIWHEGFKWFAVLRLPGRGQRTERSPVEAAHGSDDLFAACR